MNIQTKEFILTPSLYARISRSYAVKKLGFFIALFVVIIVAIFVVGVWGLFELGSLDLYFAWLPMQLVLAAWLIFLLIIQPHMMASSKLNRNDFIRGNYVFTNEYLTYSKCDGSEHKMPYRSIVKLIIGKDYLIIFENMISAFIIPAQSFVNFEEFDSISKLIAAEYSENL